MRKGTSKRKFASGMKQLPSMKVIGSTFGRTRERGAAGGDGGLLLGAHSKSRVFTHKLEFSHTTDRIHIRAQDIRQLFKSVRGAL